MPRGCGIGRVRAYMRESREMRKLQIECTEAIRVAIQQEIERSEETRYQHRLHGLLLLAAGHSCRQVAGFFGEDDTTVQRWVRRFERGPQEFGIAAPLWDGPSLSQHLRHRYGAELGVRQCQRIFRQIGFLPRK